MHIIKCIGHVLVYNTILVTCTLDETGHKKQHSHTTTIITRTSVNHYVQSQYLELIITS